MSFRVIRIYSEDGKVNITNPFIPNTLYIYDADGRYPQFFYDISATIEAELGGKPQVRITVAISTYDMRATREFFQKLSIEVDKDGILESYNLLDRVEEIISKGQDCSDKSSEASKHKYETGKVTELVIESKTESTAYCCYNCDINYIISYPVSEDKIAENKFELTENDLETWWYDFEKRARKK